MKTRLGFVSNSSTTSFCIVGIHNDNILQKIQQAEKFDIDDWYEGHGTWSSSYAISAKTHQLKCIYYGNDKPNYFGIDMDIDKDRQLIPLEYFNIQQLRKILIQYIHKQIGIKIRPTDVQLYYGEVGNG